MDTRQVHAVCTLDCPDSCGILVTVDELTGRATKVGGDPAHPVTRGFLCGKVARYLDRVYSPDRLLYPMRRRPGIPKGPLPQGTEAGAFERISWDEALDEIANRLQAVSDEFGPESILPYSYAGTVGQLGYGSMDRRFFHRLGASQLDRTICASAGVAALNGVYGTRLGTAPQDFAHAGLVIAWGANIHGNNIHLWPFIEQARRNGARLVVIDPYRTRTAALADDWLPVRPGTDVLLALALLHVLFRDNHHDPAYLDACTTGWPQLRAHALLPGHSPANAAAVTGLPADAIERLAAAYGQAGREGRPPAVIRLNYGIQRSENGGTAARAVSMLPLVTGSWQQKGGGLLLSTSGAFPFNAKKLHMPELMLSSPLRRPSRTVNMNELGLALQPASSIATPLLSFRSAAEESASPAASPTPAAPCTSPTPTPSPHTPPALSFRSAVEESAFPTANATPDVKALFVYNCNAAAVAPDSNRVLAGLRRPDLFTVVHEQFFTDTTDYADLLLPATTFLEHRELMGAYGHYTVQLSEQAIRPLGEARSNPWLFSALARRMGFTEPAFTDTDEDLITQALDTDHPWLAGITLETLAKDKMQSINLPQNAEGEVLPFSGPGWFPTSDGRAQLMPLPLWQPPVESRTGHPPPTEPREEASPQAFPLEFLPRKADHYMNTTFANLPGHQTMERRTAGVLEMHPDDATPRAITTGDAVEIFNARGRIELVARVGTSVASGVVAARLDWHKLSPEGANVNTLTSQRLTDIGGGATFYSTLVEVARRQRPAAN